MMRQITSGTMPLSMIPLYFSPVYIVKMSQGNPRPTRMLNVFAPSALEIAMSPRPFRATLMLDISVGMLRKRGARLSERKKERKKEREEIIIT